MRKYYLGKIGVRNELKNRPVSQNDRGLFFYSPIKGYWTTTIDKFDKAIPPKAYKRSTDGTHGSTNVDGVNVKRQKAYDYPAPALTPIYCSVDVKMIKTTSADGSYCVVDSGAKIFGIPRWRDVLVHTVKWAKVGTTVKAGKPICYVMKNHVHIFTQRFGLPYPIRKVILAK